MNVRQAILAAGARLLSERGVAALTQPRVAKAAAVKQSHLTYYFPKRADLMLAIAEYAIAATADTVNKRLRRQQSPRTLLQGVPPRVLLGLIVAADADPGIRRPLRGMVKRVRGHIQTVLRQSGVAADAESALMFHAAAVGLAVLHEAQRNRTSARELRRGMDCLPRLLRAQGGA